MSGNLSMSLIHRRFESSSVHRVFSLGLFPTRVDGAKPKRHKTVASVAVVCNVTGNHRFCPDLVTELRVKLHNFFGSLFINGEPAQPALDNQRRIRPKLGFRQKPVAR